MALCNVNVCVYALVVMFGLGSWLAVNGLFVELSFLVSELPEGWSLPSYITIIVQDHSTALLSLTFFMANQYEYVTAFFIGAGLSGLIPSLLALSQGSNAEPTCTNTTNSSDGNFTVEWVYGEPHFSVEIYFLCLAVLQLASGIAFLLLNVLPVCKREHDPTRVDNDKKPTGEKPSGDAPEKTPGQPRAHDNPAYEEDRDEYDDFVEYRRASVAMGEYAVGRRLSKKKEEPPAAARYSSSAVAAAGDLPAGYAPEPVKLSAGQLACLYVVQMWVSALMMGALPSVGSFSALPYGYNIYHLSLTLSTIANPLACCVPFAVTAASVPSLTGLTVLATAAGAYLLALAATSPEPPLLDTSYGGAVCVAVTVAAYALFSYVNVCLASLFREQSHRALFWCGVATQAGAFVGAIALFLPVNCFNLFEETPLECETVVLNLF
ncbi:PREDICTED: LOW QUALITY PROTEIN: solute carrier family 52, riboflavin transporter, member 3-A-like [Priapulus caudatus]|uniref:Riboflavin transporter n=1 Tax=Priapulus caudatus TaxID=37621 RepID=A0ABM1DQ46_PRICU|nr:PREDICTED: LOW QUALITY PROTEIN: solute carrier family 52, riboflavin transporter, member 3-A-like [Priapulus caudatus]